MDFDEAADRLYGMMPEEFTSARDALAKEAKAAGDAAPAKRIKALRKPTVVAWAVNRTARERGEELGQLLDLGRRLREAWRAQDTDALAEAGRERTPLIARLVRSVREEAEAAGHPLAPTADLEIEQTLDAAVVDEDAAEQVRRGRLTRPLSYSGFTPAPVVRPAPEPAARAQPAPKAGREAEHRAAEEKRRKAERERRIRELESALAEAEQAAQEAERGRADWEAERAEAVSEHERRSAKVETLTARLAKAKDKLNAAEHRLEVARREETNAERAARSARQRADQARAALDEARSAQE
ncbi:hypothetical protein [Microbispora sp. CA-102843]|uniref:hypothetical protein n=1 Tax=Microbispora sp. CA-102843 TaxID=3239952 RepID=UPI003D917DCC